jgi:N-acetylmuramoyl-L-alanine amidase
MKHVFGLWVLLASLLGATAQSSLGRLEHVFMFGADYVRLDDWARANGYPFKWTVPKREARITTPGGSLVFQADARKIRVKGVLVWVTAPLVVKNNSIYIGSADLTGTLHPILFPPKLTSPRPIKTIVLDPGHGGRDPGNQEGRQQEKFYTLALARELSALLNKAGFKVFLTRNFDLSLDLPGRPELARRRGADLFISLHFNSADGPGSANVQGAEVYCMTPPRASSTNARGEGAGTGSFSGNRFDARNVLLAYQIQRALTQKAGSEDRGVKRARFAVLRAADMPAVLIEAAFMTHTGDARRIFDRTERQHLAAAIADGIADYKRLVER